MLVVAAPGGWRTELVEGLEQAWFAVATLDDGAALVDGAPMPRADLAVVDLGLRSPSGLSVCRALRSQSPLALLAVAAAATEDDIVEACEVGADGFLPTTASVRVVLARLRGLLRRIPLRSDRTGALELGRLHLAEEGGGADVGGVALPLRPAELEVLTVLLEQRDRVVTRSELAARLSVMRVGDVELDGCLRRLRELLDRLDAGCTIRTVRKVGVQLVAPAAEPVVGTPVPAVG